MMTFMNYSFNNIIFFNDVIFNQFQHSSISHSFKNICNEKKCGLYAIMVK